MKNQIIIEKENKFIVQSYQRFPVVLHSGKGAAARDFNGNFYIDFSSGIGVNSLGFCDDGWCEAIIGQIHLLQHSSNVFYNAPSAILAERLCDLTGYARVFFANSGAEANECAIKVARKYGCDKKGSSANKIITLRNSFHGRTITTLAATGQDSFHDFFHPFTAGFEYLDPNDTDALPSINADDVCAVMIELIQGEGGVNVMNKEYIKEIEKICHKHDILLIVDEVQTGIGRTGTLLCSEQYDIHPNIVTLAKGLGGGLPIGAILMDAKRANILHKGQHGSTFGGNPIICAGAIEILNRISDIAFLKKVIEKGEYLKKKIIQMPKIKNITGKGLILGIEFDKSIDSRQVANCCTQNGLLVLLAKNKLRLMPPLNITYEEIDNGLSILQNCIYNISLNIREEA